MSDWLQFNISSLAKSFGAEVVVKFKEITPPVTIIDEINEVLGFCNLNIR